MMILLKHLIYWPFKMYVKCCLFRDLCADVTVLLLAFFLCHSSVSVAAEFIDLYKVKIAVDSEAKQQRLEASQKALEVVFVRVTGDIKATQRYPLLAANISSADQLLTSYSYYVGRGMSSDDTNNQEALSGRLITLPSPDEKAESSQLMVEFVFKPQAVKQLLLKASAPFWQASRPEVLIWLVVQNGPERKIINSEVSAKYFSGLKEASMFRGIPVVQPLLDLEELSMINEDDIWALSMDKIIATSKRYSHGAVLAGKVSPVSNGQWYGEWVLNYKGSDQREFFSGSNILEFSRLGMDLVADKMASDYAVVTLEKEQSNQWLIRVDGVHSLQEFTRLTQSLRAVPALDTIRLHSVVQASCYYYLDAVAPLQQIQALLELNESLELQPQAELVFLDNVGLSINEVDLHYVLRKR